jgi:hypothetical protein
MAMAVIDARGLSHSIRRDGNALLGMPYRLLIALISIALVVPAVMSGWSSVDYVQTDQRVRAEIARVLTAAQRYLQAGSGGEEIHVVFEGGTFTRIEYVVFGDSAGHAYSRFIRYKLSGGDEQLVTVRNPSVLISSTDGGGLTLFEGSYSMHVECVSGIDVVVWVG